MKSRSLHFFAALSVVCSVTTAFFWIRSHRRWDAYDLRMGQHHLVEFASDGSELKVCLLLSKSGDGGSAHPHWLSIDHLSAPPGELDHDSNTVYALNEIFGEPHILGLKTDGFHMSYQSLDANSRLREISVPDWIILVACILLPVVTASQWWRRKRRIRKGLCLACGYDLRGSPGICPECGAIGNTKVMAR